MMVMTLAHELHKSVPEIEDLAPDEFAEWVAFFKIRQADEKKAADKARQARGRKGRTRRQR